MSQISLLPVPYYQFFTNPAITDLSLYHYKTVPNKKINFHYPFIVINLQLIELPLEDIAIVEASDYEDQQPNTPVIFADTPPFLTKQLFYLNNLPNFETCIFVPAIHKKTEIDPKTEAGVSTQMSAQKSNQHPYQPALDPPSHANDLSQNKLKKDDNPPGNLQDAQSKQIIRDGSSLKPHENQTMTNDSTGSSYSIDNSDISSIDSNDKTKKAKLDEGLSGEEKEQAVKEAQLESYKQFLATQQNQVKIDYKGIRVRIEANAMPSRMYFIMNALSAIIASYGLVINSSAVVIGAMLVAMMLGPITGVALALIDYRTPFLRKSLFTVLAGGLMVVSIGFIVGLLHQDTPLTTEILSRTQPTSMDLMIALAGGTAGAYAMISPHLSVAVVGVAVATALVPPLAASGILMAHGEGLLGLGALLLAITNIIAIQFTNALVLWFTGFRRLVKDDYKTSTLIAFFRRNTVPLILLVGIGGYLTYNFNTITKQQKFENEVKKTINTYFEQTGNILTNAQFVNHDDHQTVRAVIRGETQPSVGDAKIIESKVDDLIRRSYSDFKPVLIQIRYLPVVVINSSPSTEDNISNTDAKILSQE